MQIKIGDKVRFLNATGGGVVTAVSGRRVTVEDEDGFPSEYAATDLVVVSAAGDSVMSQSSNVKSSAPAQGETTMSVKKRMLMDDEDATETWKDEEPVLRKMTEETSEEIVEKPIFTDDLDTEEGERLSLFLAFECKNLERIGADGFVAYLVNDSNYDLLYTIATTREGRATLQSEGRMESHTKYEFKTIAQSEINDWSHVTVQFIALKPRRDYDLKQPGLVNLKITPVRFFRRGSYVANDFFDTDVMTVNVVNNDVLDNVVIEANEPEKMEEIKMEVSEQTERQKVTSLTLKKPAEKEAGEVLVVDLQSDKMLGDVSAMSAEEVLSLQIAGMRRVMERNKKRDGQKIVFLDNRNERLRKDLRFRIKMEYPTTTIADASYAIYPGGATEVTIHRI